MIHSGSRGLGHQVATDALVLMEAAMARDKIDINDRQLACAKISSQARNSCSWIEALHSRGGTTSDIAFVTRHRCSSPSHLLGIVAV